MRYSIGKWQLVEFLAVRIFVENLANLGRCVTTWQRLPGLGERRGSERGNNKKPAQKRCVLKPHRILHRAGRPKSASEIESQRLGFSMLFATAEGRGISSVPTVPVRLSRTAS